MLRFISPSFYLHPSTFHSLLLPLFFSLPSPPSLLLPFFFFIYPNTHKSVKMGYGELDQKAINTIRVLAVSLTSPSLLPCCSVVRPSSSLNWFLPRHGCPAISYHEECATSNIVVKVSIAETIIVGFLVAWCLFDMFALSPTAPQGLENELRERTMKTNELNRPMRPLTATRDTLVLPCEFAQSASTR